MGLAYSTCPQTSPLWGVIPAGAVMLLASRIPGMSAEGAMALGLVTAAGTWALTRCAEPALAGVASVLFSYFVTRQAITHSDVPTPITTTTSV